MRKFLYTILFALTAFTNCFALDIEPIMEDCCGLSSAPSVKLAPEQAKDVDYFFDMSINDTKFKAQVAIKPEEMAKGLMFRKSLGEMEAMLFVYPSPRRVSFWMRNTLIPLDIAFIDKNAKLLEIKSMYPLDETPVPSTSNQVKFCLEVNPKFFDKHKIKVGDVFDMDLINKAIKERLENE